VTTLARIVEAVVVTDEGDPACVALLKHGRRGAVSHAQLILHADDAASRSRGGPRTPGPGSCMAQNLPARP
jgi:hypothetical protein